jgi:endonuclease/exonuclease/phosphatase (EEP) superfamily protein YafD
MRVIGETAEPNDDVILVGDFNSVTGSPTIQRLGERMHRVFSGNTHGGVDHIFSSCPSVKETRNLGTGGSDHDALSALIEA